MVRVTVTVTFHVTPSRLTIRRGSSHTRNSEHDSPGACFEAIKGDCSWATAEVSVLLSVKFKQGVGQILWRQRNRLQIIERCRRLLFAVCRGTIDPFYRPFYILPTDHISLPSCGPFSCPETTFTATDYFTASRESMFISLPVEFSPPPADHFPPPPPMQTFGLKMVCIGKMIPK